MKKLAMLLVAFAAVTFFGASTASAQSVSFSYVHGGRGGYSSFQYRNYGGWNQNWNYNRGWNRGWNGGWNGGWNSRYYTPRVYVPRVYVPRVYVAPPPPPVYYNHNYSYAPAAPVFYDDAFVATVTESVFDPYYGSRRVSRTVTVRWNSYEGAYTWVGLDGYTRIYSR